MATLAKVPYWDRPARSGLSWLAICFLVIIAAVFVVVVAVNWTNVLVVPIALLPPALIIYVVYVRWLRTVLEQDELFIRFFFCGFLPGAVVCMLVEAGFTVIFGLICLNGQVKDIMAQLSHDPQGGTAVRDMPELKQTFGFYAFVFLTSYITAATVEEVTKLAIVRLVCCPWFGEDAICCAQARRDYPSARFRTYATVALLIAASLGFSVAENLLYIFAESLSHPDHSAVQWSAVGSKALVAVVRGLVSMPVHCACVAFTALRLTLRDAQLHHREELDEVAASGGLYRFIAAADDDAEVGAPRSAGPGGKQQQQQQQKVELQASPVATLRAGGGLGGSAGAGADPFSQPAGQPGRWELMLSPAAARDLAGRVTVWPWARVLWPAIALHGTFDFQALVLAAVFTRTFGDALVTCLTLLLGGFVLGVAMWTLAQQYEAVLERVARGDLPVGITLGVDWHICGGGGHPAAAAAAGGAAAGADRRRESTGAAATEEEEEHTAWTGDDGGGGSGGGGMSRRRQPAAGLPGEADALHSGNGQDEGLPLPWGATAPAAAAVARSGSGGRFPGARSVPSVATLAAAAAAGAVAGDVVRNDVRSALVSAGVEGAAAMPQAGAVR